TRAIGAIAGFAQHRIGDGSDGQGGRRATPRRTAEQKGGKDYRAGHANRRLPARQRESEVEEEAPGAGLLQDRSVDDEQRDEGHRHIERYAEDAVLSNE